MNWEVPYSKRHSFFMVSRKVSYIASFLIVILVNACSDNAEVLKESSGNILYHVKNGNEVVTKMISTKEGEFVLVGHSGNDAFIFMMGADGKEKWYVSISESGLDDFTDVCETSDGGFVVCGFTDSYSLGVKNIYQDGLIMKFDRNGKEVWRRTYGLDRDDWLTCVIEVENGNLFLGGTNRVGDLDTWLLKLDANGDLIWTYRFEIGPYFDMCLDVEVKPDGNYAILGYSSPNGFANQIRNFKVFFASVHKDSGTINTGWIYANTRTEQVIYPFLNHLTLHKTSDGFCWMDNSSNSLKEQVILMVKTDFSGEVQSTKYLESERFDWLVDFIPDNEGFTLLGSEYSNPKTATSSRGLILRLDKAGNTISRNYSGNENGQRTIVGGYPENKLWNLAGLTWNDQIGRSKLFFQKLELTNN